jgi:prepilin peptidase CpaA
LIDFNAAITLSLLACFPVAVVYAVVSDVRSMTIPNSVSIALVLLFVPVALMSGLPLRDIAVHYGAGLAVFFVGAVLFATGRIGGGDVKLLGATAIWTGWSLLLPFLFIVAVFGGVLALLILGLRLKPVRGLVRRTPWLDAMGKQQIPYAVAIGAAAIFVFPKFPMVSSAWEKVSIP